MSSRYRPDIDGLRAVAVIPVVLYHAGTMGFGGGYVGVDIFFVISGFLITRIIDDDLRRGAFSIAHFYERRVRRIFPALIAMIAVSTAIAWRVLPPEELKHFGRSIVATGLFSSNVLFWRTTGYFDSPAGTQPLLHTWSLGVEERFYLLFPLLAMVLASRAHRIRMTILTALASASLALSILTTPSNAAFFLAPTRAWELLVGAVLALALLPPPSVALRQVGSILGLALVIWGITTFSAATPFPGVHAIAPVLGSALLIYTCDRPCLVERLLRARVLVFFGLISYSLYLWHWPLLVFAKHLSLAPLSPLALAGVVALSVVIATLSHRFVEQPFRRVHPSWSRRGIFGVAAAASVIVLAVGLLAYALDGAPGRVPAEVRSLLAQGRRPAPPACVRLRADEVSPDRLCQVGPKAAPPTFLVWGDSHAIALLPAFALSAHLFGVTGLVAAKGACAPLIGVRRSDRIAPRDCGAFKAAVLRDIVTLPSVKTVVLVGRWGNNSNPDSAIVSEDVIAPQPGDNNRSIFARGFRRTVELLQRMGKRIFVVRQTPDLPFDPMQRFMREGILGVPLTKRIDLSVHRTAQRAVDTFLDAEQKRLSFTDVRLDRYICDDRSCYIVRNHELLYWDATHVSEHGAKLIAPALYRIFDTSDPQQTPPAPHRHSSGNPD